MKFNPLCTTDRLISQIQDGGNKYDYLLWSLVVFVPQKRKYEYIKSQSYYHLINRIWVDIDRPFKTNLELQFNVKNGYRKINNSLCRPTISKKIYYVFFLIDLLNIAKPRGLSYYVITLIHYKPKSRMAGWICLWVLQVKLKNTGDTKFKNIWAKYMPFSSA